jgi:hypothetical protein
VPADFFSIATTGQLVLFSPFAAAADGERAAPVRRRGSAYKTSKGLAAGFDVPSRRKAAALRSNLEPAAAASTGEVVEAPPPWLAVLGTHKHQLYIVVGRICISPKFYFLQLLLQSFNSNAYVLNWLKHHFCNTADEYLTK